MRTIQEIEARLAEIAAMIESRGADISAEDLAALETEVAELKEERAALKATAEKRKKLLNDIAEGRVPSTVVRTFPDPAAPPAAPEERHSEEVDRFDTPEYRRAFMEYVCRGTAIPVELRANEITTAADAGATIPTTTLTEIIKKLDTYGNIYAKVRKLNIQGGVRVPILSLKPTASWVGEGKSDDQKLKADTFVAFNYYGVECKISQTLLASVVTYDAFQSQFVPLATEAVVKAVETAIFTGTGNGQPVGITVDERVPTANVLTISAADFVKWDAWKKKIFAKMKKAYRNGCFVMAQGTFDGYIDGMTDETGQPIGRVNYGIENGESYRFGGKLVETVEDDVIAPYDEAASGDVVAVFFNPTDYAINSNMQMTVTKWQDHDENAVKNKCLMICDGKLLDPNGVLIIKKA